MIKKVRVRGYRIHRDLTIYPNRKLNLIVGANESGKSTLMEAIVLALTGRINGRSAAEELNPHWFNAGLVADFITTRARGEPQRLPEIDIEVFLEDIPGFQELCGAYNSDTPTNACPPFGFVVLLTPTIPTSCKRGRRRPRRSCQSSITAWSGRHSLTPS
ncbi:ATP-binding protein [Burkholderia stagnalis]|uniref:ATP-binding protein n=1 Tax=Burkholderia stagnalis TaxID=1503054 RepID=UPI0018C83D8D|nr:AAA family ATPase [Burkholderia stagnalis]